MLQNNKKQALFYTKLVINYIYVGAKVGSAYVASSNTNPCPSGYYYVPTTGECNPVQTYIF